MSVVHLRTRPPAEDDRESDAAVVHRVRTGDIDAFGILVERHYGRCLKFAERFLGDRPDAEDAVQMAFVRAYSALGRYHEQSRFVAWLFAILTNECRAIASRERRHAKYVVVDEEALHRAFASEPASDDLGDRLARALEKLEPLLREAFLLRHVEGLSYDEMMTSTGARESALKMRVKRACDALRSMLEEP
ncbi:MAG TPA: RNA polymerase sigma factor [Gemmatimonadaceae bacterium]|nr:RNA polymerase sigma factor [Gemmatimonadaceae bacterium]